MAPSFTRFENPDAVKYDARDIVRDDVLGTLRFDHHVNDQPSPGSRDWSYLLTVYLDDSFVVYGKTYSNLRVETGHRSNTPHPYSYLRFKIGYSSGVTDAAAAVLEPELRRAIDAFIERSGGIEQLEKSARNRRRQSDAAYLERKANEKLAEARALLLQVES